MTKTTTNKAVGRKRITFISRAAPYGQNKANLCLDMALACAVFEQQVNYVFLEDGVYQLLKGQDASAINCKTLGNTLETLQLYGIENVSVDEESLQRRGISQTEILAGIKVLDRESISSLIKDSDTVFNL